MPSNDTIRIYASYDDDDDVDRDENNGPPPDGVDESFNTHSEI